jgi:hypothetical protein
MIIALSHKCAEHSGATSDKGGIDWLKRRVFLFEYWIILDFDFCPKNQIYPNSKLYKQNQNWVVIKEYHVLV